MESYQGVIIEESLQDTSVLSEVEIIKTVVSPVTPRHQTPWVTEWTMHTVKVPFSMANEFAHKLSKIMDAQHDWYADFENSTHHYAIFYNKVFCFDKQDQQARKEVFAYGKQLGIPEQQLAPFTSS